MPDDSPTSPSDPEWVDEIVRRALERAGADESPTTPAPPPTHVAPVEPHPTQTAPVEQRPAPVQRPATEPPEPSPAVPLSAPPTSPAPLVQTAPPVQPAPSDPAPLTHVGEQPPPTVDELFSDHTQQSGAPRQEAPRPGELVSAHAAATTDERVFATIGGADSPYPGLDDDPMFNTAVGLDQPDGSDTDGSSRLRGFLEWGAVIVGALAVALVIKTFLMQAYFIPSSSMEPTLEIGDRVLVNKLSYNFGDIGRGDLIVFHRPPDQPDGEDDLIKRVIALGGEVIEMRDGEVFITTAGSTEQQRLDEPYLADEIRTTGLVNTENCVNPTANSCEIPEGHVFVLGDNRTGSRDSRWFGPISEDLVVGRAFLRVWPIGDIGFL